MVRIVKQCERCGEIFEDRTKNGSQKYCSKYCAYRKKHMGYTPLFKHKPKTAGMKEIINLDAQAKEKGMSYGQYVAMGMAAELTKIKFPKFVKETRCTTEQK